MTVAQIEGKCACWTYTDERDEPSWKVVVRQANGEWLEVDEGGVSYDQTAAGLRKFIDEWIEDAELTGGEDTPFPAPDVIAVYRQAADFIEANS